MPSKRRARGAPDLLAFRNISLAPVDPRDPEARAKSISQLDALDAFWKRHFADRGAFLAAYDQYHTLDEFAERLEESLRKLIERRSKALLAGGGVHIEATWLQEPFRGLEPYEFEHAPIFFGRDALVTKAIEQLAVNARAGTAFLLVLGASGSGKSSVVKAAIVPRLMKPQRISGAQFLRRAVVRPGAADGDTFLALTEQLLRPNREDGTGLPELVAPGQDAAQLATFLRTAPDAPGFIFDAALSRLTDAGRHGGQLLAFEEAKLVLVVDQLEEIFTVSSITAEERRQFVALLASLARSGAVWVIATLRADFWHRAAEIPELVALAEGDRRLDVAAPSPAELAEMIRKPAQAAGLSFEAHSHTGLGLDAVLAEHAAAAPGVLPLLSFTLDELYKDVKARGATVLTHASYDALGGLEGAIAKRADDIMAGLPAAAQAALPRVLRALTTVSGDLDQTPVARSVPRESFAPGSPARTLVDGFTAGRLLVAANEGGGAATVRLAHEALIGRWQRARDQLAADRRDLAIRAVVERQLGRYMQARQGARRQLLLRHPDLANATDLAKRWGDELDAPTRDFIRRSGARARFVQTLTAAAAVVFALVAIGAMIAEEQSRTAQAEAEAQRQIADKRANQALVAQSLALVSVAFSRVNASDPNRAIAVALEALPASASMPDRPYVPEAEGALRDAYRYSQTVRFDQSWHGMVAGPITLASLSIDGQTVATASGPTVRLIDRRTNAQIVLPDPADDVWALRFVAKDNRLLAVTKTTARLYDLAVQKYVTSVSAGPGQSICGWHYNATLPDAGMVEPIFADASVVPDRMHFFMSTQGTVNEDFAAGAANCVPSGASLPILANVFRLFVGNEQTTRSFAEQLATTTSSLIISIDLAGKLWVMTQGVARLVPSAATEKFIAALPTTNGAQVVAALSDGTVAVFDSTSLVRSSQIPPSGQPVVAIDASPDGNQILVASSGGQLQIFARRTSNELAGIGKLEGLSQANLTTCQGSGDNRSVDAPDGMHRAMLMDGAISLAAIAGGAAADGKALGEPNTRAREAVFSADGRHLIVVAEPNDNAQTKIFLVYDASSGLLIARKQYVFGVAKQCVRMSPDERGVVLVDDADLRLSNIASGVEIGRVVFADIGNVKVLGLAFNAPGDRFVVNASDGGVTVVEDATGKYVDQNRFAALAGTDPVPLGYDQPGGRVLIVRPDQAYAWTIFPTTQSLIDAARTYLPGCIPLNERAGLYLPAEPPAWCITSAKPPYNTDAWKQWLADKEAGKKPTMPGGAAAINLKP